MARLDEWLHLIIGPLVAAGTKAPAILDALELDPNAARYLASLVADAVRQGKPAWDIRNRKLNDIRRYIRDTLPSREETARLERDLAALRRQKREGSYQARLQKHREREGLTGFEVPVQGREPACVVPGVAAPVGLVPARAVLVPAKAVDAGVLSKSEQITRDLAPRNRGMNPEFEKLLHPDSK